MIDFENQNIDDLEINPYEIVVATSKIARKINDRIRNSPEEAASIRPTSRALELILDPHAQFVYEKQDNENEEEL